MPNRLEIFQTIWRMRLTRSKTHVLNMSTLHCIERALRNQRMHSHVVTLRLLNMTVGHMASLRNEHTLTLVPPYPKLLVLGHAHDGCMSNHVTSQRVCMAAPMGTITVAPKRG